MADARGKAYWSPWGMMLAMFANANRDTTKSKREFHPGDFNPYEKKPAKKRKRGIPFDKESAQILREAFLAWKRR